VATVIPHNDACFTAAEVSFVCGGALFGVAPELVFTGVCTDSRAIWPGCLFVALRGESFDGHAFVASALRAGAAGVLVETPSEGARGVVVEDTLVALGALARQHRRRSRAIVVGVTGSVGKTTTKELTATALRTRLGEGVLATRGNLNNRIGVPMTLFGLRAEHRAAVIEMGTSVRGEIAALTAIAEPDVSILVSVGLAHAEGLAGAPRVPGEPWWVGRVGPREAVAKEKAAIFAGTRAVAVACADDAFATAALAVAPAATRRKTFGRAATADVRIEDERWDDQGRANATLGGRPFSLALLGDVALLDAAGAIAAADEVFALLGLGPVPHHGLSAARSTPGRLALRRRRDGAWVVDDTYNASPTAFVSSLTTARRMADAAGRRLVVVAGEMRELGDFADEAHDEVARAIAAVQPDRVISLGGAAERYGGERFANAADAAALIEVGPRDLVLVKASRGVGAEVVVDAILAHGGEIPDAGAKEGS